MIAGIPKIETLFYDIQLNNSAKKRKKRYRLLLVSVIKSHFFRKNIDGFALYVKVKK
jgi:hypothetical protein